MYRKLYFFILLFLLQVLTGNAQSVQFTVDKSGHGDFRTIHEAINAVKDSSATVTVILIKPGVYKEKLRLPESKMNVHFIGEDVNSTILTYDDYASKKDSSGKEIGTSGSSSFFIFGSGFSAENITFENSSGPIGQAVAIRITGDRARFINCRFLGFQDTLYTQGTGSRQYYLRCYIEGTVDFIFGAATALFDSCIIYGKKAGFFTAASTPEGVAYGYVFRHCRFTGDAAPGSFYLGRPWRPFAKVLILDCYLGPIVHKAGWDNWSNPANEQTAFYAEYGNYGEGADLKERVSWIKPFSKEDVAALTITRILGGWNPLQ
jgi:pectinesterase